MARGLDLPPATHAIRVERDLRVPTHFPGVTLATDVYHPVDDAAATADWITAQPWSDGRIATWGASYLGYCQWALAAAEGPHPAAMVPVTTSATLGGPVEDGALRLDAIVRWMVILDAMENRALPWWQRFARMAVPAVQRRVYEPAFTSLPLRRPTRRCSDTAAMSGRRGPSTRRSTIRSGRLPTTRTPSPTRRPRPTT